MKPPLRTKSVGTKVSEAEFALLEERARGAGMRLAEWVREALLAAPVEPVAGSGVEAGGKAVVYGPAGEKLGVFNGSTYTTAFLLPGGSEAYYTSGALTSLRRKDWLGSSRVATSWSHAVVSKAAYAPFGESYSVGGTTDLDFAGQTQDSVSSLYDFPAARKYDPGAGRWTTPDPGGWSVVDFSNPQTLNRYAYVINSPQNLTDPQGLDYQFCPAGPAIDPNAPPQEVQIPCVTISDSSFVTAYSSQSNCFITGSSLACGDGNGGYGFAGSISYTPSPGQAAIDAQIASSAANMPQQDLSGGQHGQGFLGSGPGSGSGRGTQPDMQNRCSVLISSCHPLPNCLAAGATHLGHAITSTISPLPSVSTGIGAIGGGGDLVVSGSKAVSSKAGPIALLAGFIYNLGSEVLSELETPTPCY